MLSNHLISLCHPLLLLPSIIPSIRVFPNKSALTCPASSIQHFISSYQLLAPKSSSFQTLPLSSDLAGSELRPWQRSWGRRLGIRKGGIEPQESPWKFLSIYPQNQSLPTFRFVLSPTPLTLQGAVPHYLQLQLIKFLGVIVFQPTNSFGSPLACLNRFFWPHVIVQSLPTVRGRRCSKLSEYRFLWAVKRLIRNCIGEGFFTCWANVCC